MKDLEQFEVRLETNISYLENKVNMLNDIVVSLQSEIMKLQKQNEYLYGKVQELDSEERPNRKPPHY